MATCGICAVSGLDIPWTLSTQAYINGLAFATGLCPIAGKYGWKWGVVAGLVSAIICTSTAAMHGGFVLYNGGFNAGLTAGDDVLEADYLSKGTSDLTYLALRCALCDEIFRSESPMLVLDETFAHFDKDRLTATLSLLGQRQCLVFTCRDDEVKAAEELGFGVTHL